MNRQLPHKFQQYLRQLSAAPLEPEKRRPPLQNTTLVATTTHAVKYQLRSHPNIGDVVVPTTIIEGITIEVVIYMPQSLLVLGNLIGSGAYGSVYEARWGCQQCAAKTFFLTQSDFDEKEIQNEIKVLQRLRHRNIVQFYRTHKQDNHIYLIMELAENGSLAKAINKGLLDWHDKTRIAHEIARGLEYIHQENVLHRNLKSANVLLTRHMEAKIADFGLARIRSTVISSRSTSYTGGRIIGTLGWIAPELFQVNRPPYSTKTDIYALGVVMWEMAADCTRPYKDQENGELIAHHVKSGYRENLPDDTPTEYREWVERCWHHDPAQRPDANEVILMRGQKEESDDDDDAVPISLTFSDDKIILNGTKGRPMSTSHRNKDTPSGSLPETDDDVVKYFCKEAQQGNADAQLFLGWIYRHDGDFIKKNMKHSAWWYRKAAERGNATAQFILGEMYENGQGVDMSDVKAAIWYRRAAVHGVAKAQIKMAVMYEVGFGVHQDYAEAARWYRMAANQGLEDAQVKLGLWYALGRGVDQSGVEAVKWFTKAAEQGDEEAQYDLWWIYSKGYVVQSDDEVVKWLTKSAEQGHPYAQMELGATYEKGRGVEPSHVKAAMWYREAAEQEYADAQYKLGLMYDQGRGVEQCSTIASWLYTKAARQGDIDAQYRLGLMYQEGRGVKKSDTEAVKWYTKASEQLHDEAIEALIKIDSMSDEKKFSERNDIEAVKWYKK
ncbi:hypothetical protein BGW41_004603, partial [Actinomortierella wolfii]